MGVNKTGKIPGLAELLVIHFSIVVKNIKDEALMSPLSIFTVWASRYGVDLDMW